MYSCFYTTAPRPQGVKRSPVCSAQRSDSGSMEAPPLLSRRGAAGGGVPWLAASWASERRVAVLLGVPRHSLVLQQHQLAAEALARVARQDDVVDVAVLGRLRRGAGLGVGVGVCEVGAGVFGVGASVLSTRHPQVPPPEQLSLQGVL